jgi:hypothetical protein
MSHTFPTSLWIASILFCIEYILPSKLGQSLNFTLAKVLTNQLLELKTLQKDMFDALPTP